MAEMKEAIEPGYIVSDIIKGLNSGKYTWNVQNKQLVNNMLTAKHKQTFKSEPFVVGNLKWQIDMHPNGETDESKGYVNIFLRLLSLPSTLEQVTLSWCISCNKTMMSSGGIARYTQSSMSWGLPLKSLPLSTWKIMNVDTISISVNINIIKIVLNKNRNSLMFSYFKAIQSAKLHQFNQCKFDHTMNTRYEWKIDASAIHLFKNSKNQQPFQSSIYDNMWKLVCYPNGIDNNSLGFISLYLRLFTVPPFISNIKIRFTVSCKETHKTSPKYTDEFGYDRQILGISKLMRLSDIHSLQCMTFTVDIEIVKVIYVETNQQNENHIYDPMKIAQILSIVGDVKLDENVAVSQEMKQQELNNNNNEQFEIMDARLNSLSLNIKQYNNMMKGMQNNIQRVTKQMSDLRRIMMEEMKNDDLDDMRNQMKILQENVDRLMSDNKHKNDENSISKWLTNTVKLPQYIDLFMQNGLDDMSIIKHIKMNELTMIGMDKIGHKIKILKEIEVLIRNENKEIASQYEGSTTYN